MPPEFEATSRKWYVVDFFRDETAADSFSELVPEPALLAAVFEPYDALVPYSNHQVVASPFGERLPFRRAEVGATDEALPVVTEGAELVRKEASEPWVVPPSLVATSRKW